MGFLIVGLLATCIGLLLSIKYIDPKYFNAFVGSIVLLLSFFGLAGKLIQDVSSSKTQSEIKSNTERILQPFIISSLQFGLEYNLDDNNIKSVVNKVDSLKTELETSFSKAPPAVNGTRELPQIPGIIAFEENNKIMGPMAIEGDNILKSLGYIMPLIKMQLSNKYPHETKTSQGDGTFLVNYDFPLLLELQTGFEVDPYKLIRVVADFKEKKITFFIQPTQWHFTADNGEILSFSDLFGKILKISAYYSSWMDNKQKFSITSMLMINDKKKLNFNFATSEKSNSIVDFNAACIHQISKDDFVKQ